MYYFPSLQLKCFFLRLILIYLRLKLKELIWQNSNHFADKLKKKKKSDLITVKFIKSMKTAGGNYKFNEKFVQLDDLNKLSEVK